MDFNRDLIKTYRKTDGNRIAPKDELLPIKQIFEGGVSYARNPKIQNMLRMVGYGENVGSGFPTIISAWKEAHWGEPELKNKFEIDEVELVLPIPVRGG